MRRNVRWLAALAGLLVLGGAAQAQQRVGSGSFGGSSGSSSSGFSGSSGSGFAGGSSGSSGFAGGSGGTFSGSGGFAGQSGGGGSFSGSSGSFAGGMGSGGRSGTATYGQTSPIGRFYGNPLSMGYAGSTTGSNTGGSIATQGIRAFPETLSFGQPIVNQANLRTSQLGTGSGALGGSGLGGNLGSSSSLGQQRAFGASSMGTRRAPQYLTEPGFARTQPPQQVLPQPQPTPNGVGPQPAPVSVQTTVSLRGADLQKVIAGSTRLPSRENINVTVGTDGVVVLRGTVGSERERRMAEATLRLSPGVREVRNELQMSRTRR
jgi:hypothetical protein